MTVCTLPAVQSILDAFEIVTPSLSGFMGKAIYFPSKPHKWSSATLDSMQAHTHLHHRDERSASTVWRMVSQQRENTFSRRYGYLRYQGGLATTHALDEWIAETPDAALRALAIHEAGERQQQSRLFGHHTYHAFRSLYDRQADTETERPTYSEPLSPPASLGEQPDIRSALTQLQQSESTSKGLRLPGDLLVTYNGKRHVFGVTLPAFLATALDLPKQATFDIAYVKPLQAALEAYYQLFLYAGMDNMLIGLTAPSGSCTLDSMAIVGLSMSDDDLTGFAECVYLIDRSLKLTSCMLASSRRTFLRESALPLQYQLMTAIFNDPKHHASDAAESAIARHALAMLRSLNPVMERMHQPLDSSDKQEVDALLNELGVNDYVHTEINHGRLMFNVGKPFYAFGSQAEPTSFTTVYKSAFLVEAIGGALSMKKRNQHGKLDIDLKHFISF